MTRKIELDVEVPGTVEEVWETIATGPGITSWFTPMTVEPHEGGEVVMDFGDYGTETSTVTAWEPPHRVVFEGGGDQPLAYEWLVEASGSGSCVVRLVNSGFGDGDDWDDQYDGMSEGWRIFLENLRLQLTHFRNERARTWIPMAMLPGPREEAWTALCDAIGVPSALEVGDHVVAGVDTPGLAGTVASTVATDAARTALLVLDDGAGTGFISLEGNGEQVAGSLYLYFYDDAAAVAGPAWEEWMRSTFSPVGAGQATE